MTSAKAVAGGIAANLVTIALWLISLIPGWDTVPSEPQAAIIALVSAAIGAGVVYYAPANALKTPVQPPPAAPELG
jgi:hypothetical protein